MAVGSFFFSTALTAQNSPELHFYFINSFIQPSRAGALGAHWTYFMQILSNYNTKSLYHIENSVIKALKSDIFHSYTCEINIGDIWLQFEKMKKLRQMVLSYRNIKNEC